MEQRAYLVLENGQVFEGVRFGAEGDVAGEVVFTTGMTGYLETLTDPSYYGQIVVQTFPLIGNYGVISEDYESARPFLKAYIVREWCQEPSNFRCEGTLDTFLKAARVVGLAGIDTRALTKIIREHGVMNGCVCTDPQQVKPQELKSVSIESAVRHVTCAHTYAQQPPQGARRRVVLWDFGAKENIARELLKRGCEVVHVPANANAAEIIALSPDGVMLSNGPGDPAQNTRIINELRELVDSIRGQEHPPCLFGICLGHQLLALSQGAKTGKLKYGHRGENQPVKALKTGRVYITSQNHGYAVLADTLPAHARESYRNANDGTCEGVDYTGFPAFSVQFHPEAAAGPLDTGFLFDEFIKRMEEGKKCR